MVKLSFVLVLLLLASFPGGLSAQTNPYKAEIREALQKLPASSRLEKLAPDSKAAIEKTREAWQELLAVDDLNSNRGKAALKKVNESVELLEEVAVDRSCIQRCADERNANIRRNCGNYTPWPCTCCVSSNLLFGLCVSDCLLD